MTIIVVLFPPYSVAVGKNKIEINMNDNKKVGIQELIVELIGQFPKLQSLLPKTLSENGIYGNLFPVRGKKMLHMEDEIYDQDIIKIYGSLSGG